jgi:DDE superfamily endonuclease
VLGLRWFRDRTMPDALARDHGISRATAYRYLEEIIAVLADEAPELHEALERAEDAGFSHVILDGKIIACDRCKEPAISVKGEVIDLWYSGKAHTHGGTIQAVTAPDGLPLWVSEVEPGSVHDITTARLHALPALYRAAAAGLPTLADPGYEGAGLGILIPVKQPQPFPSGLRDPASLANFDPCARAIYLKRIGGRHINGLGSVKVVVVGRYCWCQCCSAWRNSSRWHQCYR